MKKAGFVAVVGRPSAGKSTLVNQVCGGKVAIVSPVPQTTRNAIRGIVNREGGSFGAGGQLVFIDTPGRHLSEKKVNKKLMDISDQAMGDSDIILYVLDSTRPPGPEETEIAARLAPHSEKVIAAINKIDSGEPVPRENDVRHNAAAYPDMTRAFLAQHLPDLAAERCFEISALTGDGIDSLLAALFDLAPEGEPFYGEEFYTDQEVDFRIAEIIREQAINRLREELPHTLRIEIADTQLTGTSLWVRAFIIVERESQKGIVIGKSGTMIKAIRLAALKELREIFDWDIELDLRVKADNR
ncbi:MAG: GTPase Era [Treponema sp.]|nr:GTPase Era [Treponema sp.]